MLIPFFVILALMILFLVSSIRILRESQRAAVFRLGQFVGVAGPGIIFLIPMIDKANIVDLNKWIPEWQQLSSVELDERVKAVAFSYHEQ